LTSQDLAPRYKDTNLYTMICIHQRSVNAVQKKSHLQEESDFK